ncbi:MAG: Spy/CpxP family protein refolding chaperone [Dictyoglomaceae bacterium]|nr:Spy/CpxP family protein refolding chaperone [Dictyoglomaceae bacterium]
MRKVKILLSFILAFLLLFSFTYAFSRDKFQDRLRVRVLRPFVPEKSFTTKPTIKLPFYFSDELRKLIAERNKLWFELRELLRDKQLNLSKIEEKAKELQRLEEEISKKIQASFLGSLSKNLNLTKDQESSVKKIIESYNDKLEALRKDLKGKNIELKTIDPKDKEKISAKKKEIREILSKLSDTRKQLVEEIKKILTEEQRKKLDKYFKLIYPYEFRFYPWRKL